MRKQQQGDRRAQLAALRTEQQRKERRRSALLIGLAAGVAAAVIAAAAIPLVLQERRQGQVEAAAARPIDGVQEFSDLSKNHVTTPVDYPQTPPVGGDHAGVWTNCGAYPGPVNPVQGVHSLEHGAVWVTYRPGLPGDQLDVLTELARRNDYVLLSPLQEAPSPVVVSAWGKQLKLDDAKDGRLAAFVEKWAQSPEAPEPGAPCTGGAGPA